MAQAANRLALVIGNDNYASVEKLKNAKNDARLMARTLRDARFDVTELVDQDLKSLWRAIDAFSSRIQKGDEVVFYFAGHGVQIDAEAILLPVDIVAENGVQVMREGVPVSRLHESLRDAKFALLVLDACRDNPFPKKGTRTVGGERGLPPVEAAEGMAIIMSAGRGQKALDTVPGQTENNGLFTYEFVQAIKRPGVDVRRALIEVRERVEDQAKRANNLQRPALVDETRGNFYFFGSAPVVAAVAVPTNTVRVQSTDEIEQEFWNSIKDSKDVQDFQDYVSRNPSGRFIAQAARQIRLLNASIMSATATPPLTSVATVAAGPVVVVPNPSAIPAEALVVTTPAKPASVAPAPIDLKNALAVAAVQASIANPSGSSAPGSLVPVPGEITIGSTKFKGRFVQERADRSLTGEGEIRWANGDVFVGALLRGKRHGLGESNWSTGQSYNGEWVEDQPNGKGAMKFPSGDQYTGEVLKGVPTGRGAMVYASGDKYSGDFASGAANGQGTYVWRNGQQFAGAWVNDKPNGAGVLRFASGDVYEGSVVDGRPQGTGTMRYASADVYVGGFEAGKPNGVGTYSWKSGDAYAGQWRAGLKHGKGSFTWASGDRWDGEFADDRQTANGQVVPKK